MYNLSKDKNFENALRLKLGKKFKIHYLFSNTSYSNKDISKSIKYHSLTSKSIVCTAAFSFISLILSIGLVSLIPMYVMAAGLGLMFNRIRLIKKADFSVPIPMFTISYKIEHEGRFLINKLLSNKDHFSKYIEIKDGEWYRTVKTMYEVDKQKVIDMIYDDLHIQLRKTPT